MNTCFRRTRVERWKTRKTAGASELGVVTSQHYAASEAGAAVLASGGNAVDAAVSAAFVLQAVEPWMTSLAACGYLMVVEPTGTAQVIEFTGSAASQLDVEAYAPDPNGVTTFLGMPASISHANVRGYSSVVVPGCVRGFAEALRQFGTFGFDRALVPAIEHARDGLLVDWHTSFVIAMAQADLCRDAAARAVLLPGGAPPEPGTVLPLMRLAATLTRLADAGPDDFFCGRIAERLVGDLRAGGSAISAEDLARYQPVTYPAKHVSLGNLRVHVPGATSGGQRLHDALVHFDRHRGRGPADAGFFVGMVHALWDAFSAHRKRLTAAELNATTSTSHVNAVDHEGRMVAITFTLLNRFGARVLSPSTGIILNNGMAWFDPRPGRPNSLRPGGVGANNMCPTAITRADGAFAVLGASGGNQIVPSLAQIAAMLIHADMSVEQALNAPRMNTGPTREIVVDVDLAPECLEQLARLGTLHPAQRTVYPRPFASPSAIGRRKGGFIGMPDTSYPAAYAATP